MDKRTFLAGLYQRGAAYLDASPDGGFEASPSGLDVGGVAIFKAASNEGEALLVAVGVADLYRALHPGASVAIVWPGYPGDLECAAAVGSIRWTMPWVRLMTAHEAVAEFCSAG